MQKEFKQESSNLWIDPYKQASLWKPCAQSKDQTKSVKSNGYILISANGGLNQQRVAVSIGNLFSLFLILRYQVSTLL